MAVIKQYVRKNRKRLKTLSFESFLLKFKLSFVLFVYTDKYYRNRYKTDYKADITVVCKTTYYITYKRYRSYKQCIRYLCIYVFDMVALSTC